MKQLSEKTTGHLAILSATVIFAFNTPVSKYLVSGYIYPLGLSASRVLFGFIAFWLVSFFTKKEVVEAKDHWLLLLGGITGLVFNFGCYTYGLNLTSSIDAAVLVASTPLFTLLLSALILKEPITKMKFVGMLMGIVGAILIIYNGGELSFDKSHMWGNLIVISSSISFAIYLVVCKPIAQKYSPVTLMKWMFTYAIIFLLPFTYRHIIEAPLFNDNTNPTALLAFLYPLLGSTLLAYSLVAIAQRRIRATTQSMYNNLQPMIVTIVSVIFFTGTLSWLKAGAGCLVLTGVYLVTKSKSRAEKTNK